MQSIEDIFCQKLGKSSFLLYQNLFLPAYLTNIGDAATRAMQSWHEHGESPCLL